MLNDGTIRSWTAIDIEKYHRGLLSAKEMHDLEKAALDDPFLADAMEGYALPGINAAADIAEVKKRLSERTEESRKVIPMAAPSRSSFPWLRAAAMIILVLGAGFLVYQFGFNKDSSPIANTQKEDITGNTDSNNKSVVTADAEKKELKTPSTLIADSMVSLGLTATDGRQKNEEPEAQKEIKALPDTVISGKPGAVDGYYKKPDQAVVAPPPPVIAESQSAPQDKKLTEERKLTQQQPAKQSRAMSLKEGKAEELSNGERRIQDSVFIANGVFSRDTETAAVSRENQYRVPANVANENQFKDNNLARTNVFRGQVVDASNNVVPFANITNTADNIGTYTDAKGNFTLTSPDSVLNVQVRSLGYENNISQLNNQLLNNQVVMQEDRSLKEVVVSQKKVNSTRSRTSTMVLDEPEPIDGWKNYDAYLANNLNVPETYKRKQAETGSVTLSFEVNSKGEPVNITVTKSLCESCDKEAIRLVKEGPKWKRKSRKGRTTVTIPF
jgi:TonB family protein